MLDLEVGFDELTNAGSMMGSGGLVVLDDMLFADAQLAIMELGHLVDHPAAHRRRVWIVEALADQVVGDMRPEAAGAHHQRPHGPHRPLAFFSPDLEDLLPMIATLHGEPSRAAVAPAPASSASSAKKLSSTPSA